MEDGQRTIEPVLTDYKNKYATDWSAFLGAKWTDQADTGVPLAELTRIGEKLTTVPENFTVHSLVNKLLNDRRNMARGEQKLDRSEEHTSELQSLMRISYAVLCLKQKKKKTTNITIKYHYENITLNKR